MIIAIDGPAGAGKSTIAKTVAKKLGITFLNSGSFYRGVALAASRKNLNPADEEGIIALAESLSMEYGNGHLILNGEDVENLLHSDKIDLLSSRISCIIPIRHCINNKLRKIPETQSIVCEGRDMTTVVFPQAEYKFYLDASLDAQAERRYKQGVSTLSLEEIRQAIRKRDEIDRNKAEGSLKIAKEAHYIDTSDLTIEEVCEIIICKIHL